MNPISKRRWVFSALAVAVSVVLLGWPVEQWLECHERQFVGKFVPDAVYLVAGASEQSRRIDALVELYSGLVVKKSVANHSPAILIGNDRLKNRWSTEEQRNLTGAEWGVKRLAARIKNTEVRIQNQPAETAVGKQEETLMIQIVPGIFTGTDGEMEALSAYLASHLEINSLVLVTSPFHVRRLLGRLDRYMLRDVQLFAVTGRRKWNDSAPWVVSGELLKMGRDSLGLSRAPIISRQSP